MKWTGIICVGVKPGAMLKGANLKPACGIDGTPINCVFWRHSDVYSGDFTMATTSDRRKETRRKEGYSEWRPKAEGSEQAGNRGDEAAAGCADDDDEKS